MAKEKGPCTRFSGYQAWSSTCCTSKVWQITKAK